MYVLIYDNINDSIHIVLSGIYFSFGKAKVYLVSLLLLNIDSDKRTWERSRVDMAMVWA